MTALTISMEPLALMHVFFWCCSAPSFGWREPGEPTRSCGGQQGGGFPSARHEWPAAAAQRHPPRTRGRCRESHPALVTATRALTVAKCPANVGLCGSNLHSVNALHGVTLAPRDLGHGGGGSKLENSRVAVRCTLRITPGPVMNQFVDHAGCTMPCCTATRDSAQQKAAGRKACRPPGRRLLCVGHHPSPVHRRARERVQPRALERVPQLRWSLLLLPVRARREPAERACVVGTFAGSDGSSRGGRKRPFSSTSFCRARRFPRSEAATRAGVAVAC